MCFDKRRNNSYVDLAVVVNNESVKMVETMDYLGHTTGMIPYQFS